MTDKHRQDENTAEEILRLMEKCGMKFFPGCKNLINEMNKFKYEPQEKSGEKAHIFHVKSSPFMNLFKTPLGDIWIKNKASMTSCPHKNAQDLDLRATLRYCVECGRIV